MNRRLPAAFAALCAINLLALAGAHVGKLLISAQFTRGFCIGTSITLDAFFVVWVVVQARQAGTRLPSGR